MGTVSLNGNVAVMLSRFNALLLVYISTLLEENPLFEFN